MNLTRATSYAERIAGELTPMCQQIAIVGSIRRRRPTCNDIDLVILPKDRIAIRQRCLQGGGTATTDGALNLIVQLRSGVQLDIFFARPAEQDLFNVVTPSTWATLLLCRTGSKDFNFWFCRMAEAKGLHWNPYLGLHRKPERETDPWPLIPCETEAELFRAVGLDYINPEDRER